MLVGQLPPAQLARATGFRLRGRVHFRRDVIGEVVEAPDDAYVVFRKLVLDPSDGQPERPGAIFTVRFRFARFSAGVNRRLSAIPAPFIAAQPGFRSKTWTLGRDSGWFKGVYEWDSIKDAEAYWTSFPMRMMKRRAIPGSVEYTVEAI